MNVFGGTHSPGEHIPRRNTYHCNTGISAAKQLSKVCRDIPQFAQEILRQNVSSEQSLILISQTRICRTNSFILCCCLVLVKDCMSINYPHIQTSVLKIVYFLNREKVICYQLKFALMTTGAFSQNVGKVIFRT